jgi:hypothetical protein
MPLLGDLPVQLRANALGLTVPTTLLSRTDKVID